jgi:hypothetical protein
MGDRRAAKKKKKKKTRKLHARKGTQKERPVQDYELALRVQMQRFTRHMKQRYLLLYPVPKQYF